MIAKMMLLPVNFYVCITVDYVLVSRRTRLVLVEVAAAVEVPLLLVEAGVLL